MNAEIEDHVDGEAAGRATAATTRRRSNCCNLVLRQVAQTWKMPPRKWRQVRTQFARMFDEKFVKA